MGFRSRHLDVVAAATILWELLTKEAKVLAKVTLRSQQEKPLAGDVWQVNSEKLVVEQSQSRHRCTTCQRIATRPAPKSACTRHNCHGTTVAEQPDQENYDVWLMGRPFVMVSAEEHTAQVPGEVRNRIENDFKSAKGRTNCLVATPTLELGVNIGALDMALMRNVPPRAANYWQRAGRAGREERMAVVVTYCRRSPHDRYFFDDPLRLLGGAIEAPAFNLRNPLMVAKHIRSAILSELLLQSRMAGESGEKVRQIVKELFPVFIRTYLLDEETTTGKRRPSTEPLKASAQRNEGFAWPIGSRPFLPNTGHPKRRNWRAVLPSNRLSAKPPMNWRWSSNGCIDASIWAKSTRADLHRKKDTGPLEREEEQLLRRCDEYINSIIRCDQSTYTLTVLGVEGFLPGYGVYEGGITASAQRGFARRPGLRAFDLNRSNVVALREFVPGNRLYANRGTFYVARYHLGAEETARIRTLRVNVEKGYVTEQAADASYGQSGGVAIDALPLTDLDLALESRITEDENLRFSMPVCVLGRLRKRNRGGKAFKIGDMEVSYVRGQGIELVNLGEAGRVKQGELGHWICSVCGASKTPYAVPAEIAQFMKIHKERCGRDVAKLALTVQADVDLLQFHAVKNEAEGINIGEALRTAAARLLDMGPDDLQLLIVEKSDDKHDLLIYDPMPGGSGLLEQMLVRWQELIATAKNLLAGCVQECETACYACLKTFRNQFYHAMLNRHDGLELMDKLNHLPKATGTSCRYSRRRSRAKELHRTRPKPIGRIAARNTIFPRAIAGSGLCTSIGIATTAGLGSRADQGGRVRGRHEPGASRRSERGEEGPHNPSGRGTGRMDGHRGAVPRPERPASGAAAFAEHRSGDGTGGFDGVEALACFCREPDRTCVHDHMASGLLVTGGPLPGQVEEQLTWRIAMGMLERV